MAKNSANCPYADPEAAAKRILGIANSIEPVMKGRIYIELGQWSFLNPRRRISCDTQQVAGC